MSRRVILLLCLLACSPAATAQKPAASAKPAAAQETELALSLSDGSRVVGTPDTGDMEIKTQYSGLSIQFSKISSIVFAGDGKPAEIHLKNGDRITGTPVAAEFRLITQFGEFAIPVAVVRSIVQHKPGRAGVMPDGVVLYFTFDDIGDNRVIDISGWGNDGTINGATSTREGKVGDAMKFPGNGAGIVVKNADSLHAQDLTIMAWVKCDVAGKPASGPSAVIFGCGHSGYGLGMDTGGKIYLCKTGVGAVFSSCKIDDTLFHHIAVTRKGSKVVFYIDGGAFPADDFNMQFEFGTGFTVGEFAGYPDYAFRGLIDEVAVFNRPLTAEEVRGIYESQK